MLPLADSWLSRRRPCLRPANARGVRLFDAQRQSAPSMAVATMRMLGLCQLAPFGYRARCATLEPVWGARHRRV